MQYINKSKNAAKGYQIVDTLKEEAWNDDKKRYIGFDYGGLSKEPFRSDFKTLTLEEQTNCCCYCMKKININDSNLEHVIPQKVSKVDFNRYLSHTKALKEHVFHKDELNLTYKLEKLEKYPHDIAYHNLVSSCLNKFHCNSKRGSEYIEPITYDEKIGYKVVYAKNGSIDFEENNDYLEDIYDKLGLNNRLLSLIRRLWYLLAQRFETIPYPIDLEDSIYEVIALDEDMENLMSLATDGNNVTIASKAFPYYEWFFYYYKNKYS